MSDLLPRFDGALVNATLGAGIQGRDKSMGYQAGQMTLLTKEFVDILHAESFECANVIECLPEEMTREWIEISIDDGDSELIAALAEYDKKLQLRSVFRDAQIKANLYGGAIAILYIDDGQTPDKPLNEKRIKTIEGASAIDRWQISAIGGTLEKPESYSVIQTQPNGLYTASGSPMNTAIGWSGLIHSSRVLRFDGDWAPTYTRQLNQGWGLSKLQRFLKPFQDYFAVYQSLGAMVQDASIFTYGIKGLMDILKGGGKDALRERLRENWMAASVYGAWIKDAELESISFTDRNFSGLDQMADRFERRLVAGSDGLPHSYVLGRAGPNGGLDGNGEAEEKYMAKLVKRRQEKCFRSHLERCFELIGLAADSPIKDKKTRVGITFRPLYLPSPQEIADLEAAVIQKDATAISSGIYTADEAAVSHYSTPEFNPAITIDWDKRKADQEKAEADAAQAEADELATLLAQEEPVEEVAADSSDRADSVVPPISVQRAVQKALKAKPKLPFRVRPILAIADQIAKGRSISAPQIDQAIRILSKSKAGDVLSQLLGGNEGLKWLKAARAQAISQRVDAGEPCGNSFIAPDKECTIEGYSERAIAAFESVTPKLIKDLTTGTDKQIEKIRSMTEKQLERFEDPDGYLNDEVLNAAIEKHVSPLQKANKDLEEDLEDISIDATQASTKLGKVYEENLKRLEKAVEDRQNFIDSEYENIPIRAATRMNDRLESLWEKDPETLEEFLERKEKTVQIHRESLDAAKQEAKALGIKPQYTQLKDDLDGYKEQYFDEYSGDPEDWVKDSIDRADSIRPSCLECVEKHLGSAIVLMDEVDRGYPEHRILAIGHLAQAEEESHDEYPQLSEELRSLRKQYQSTGVAPDYRAIVEALKVTDTWRGDAKQGQIRVKNGKTYVLNKNSRWESAKQSAKHAGEHIGENVAAWSIGKVVGGAIAGVAASHGLNPDLSKQIAETGVQAFAATLIHARKPENRTAGNLVRKFLSESAGAFAGKMAHSGVDDAILGGDDHVRMLAAAFAGKGTGAATTVTAGTILKRHSATLKSLLDRQRVPRLRGDANSGDTLRLTKGEKEALFDLTAIALLVADDGDRNDAESLYGVWFGGRRTPIVVDADSREGAIAKAREKKKRGGDEVDAARLLNEAERKTVARGDWVRTGAKGEPAGYRPSKSGYGPEPHRDAGTGKPCGKGWAGFKPPGCKRAKSNNSTKPASKPVTKTKPTSKSKKREIAPADVFPASLDSLQVISNLGGSTGAKLVVDPQTGKQYVLKRGASPDHVREEFAADRLYESLGIPVPKGKLYDSPSGTAKLSEFVDGKPLHQLQGQDRADAIAKLQKHFAVDAVLGNWDVIGNQLDNVIVASDGTPYRIDNGGSLRFRAMGSKKNASDFDGIPNEMFSMRKTSPNKVAGEVFGGLDYPSALATADNLVSGKQKLLKAIANLPMSESDRVELGKTIGKRIDGVKWLRKSYQDLISSQTLSADIADFHEQVFSKSKTGIALPATKKTQAEFKKYTEKPGWYAPGHDLKPKKLTPTALKKAMANLEKFDDFIRVRATQWESRFSDPGWNSPPPPPSSEELGALTAYTSNAYKQINNTLRGKYPTKGAIDAAKIINSALAQLPAYGEQSYRGADLTEAQLAKYEVGKEYVDPAFGSTATTPAYAWSGNTYFIYEPKPKNSVGKKIDRFSEIESENEVLYPAGSKFKVKSKQIGVNISPDGDSGNKYKNLVILEEI